MRQLVQLKQKTSEFKKLKAEVVVVFREERKQVDGIKAIQKRRQTKFTLLTDLGARKTKAYSRKRGQFATYLIDKKGVVREIIDGTKAKRPKSELILAALKKLDAKKGGEKKESKKKS